MKYEFKPYSPDRFGEDLQQGWKPTYQVAEDYPDTPPRDIDLVDLGPTANYKFRLASIDLAEGGVVRTHSEKGLFSLDQEPCCLDIILYREATPKPREIAGMAYVTTNGVVVAIRCVGDKVDLVNLHDLFGGAIELNPVPCTITLHEST